MTDYDLFELPKKKLAKAKHSINQKQPPHTRKTRPTISTPAPPRNDQSRFAEKMRLDQQAAGITGGKTGLIMLLDAMINETGQNAFRFYADAYLQRMERLVPLLNSYKKIEIENEDVQKYNELLRLGRTLQSLLASGDLELWREKAKQWFDRYNRGDTV